MTTKSIYEHALDVWGVLSQKNQVIEECSEVIQAICHYRRGKCNIDEVVGELADIQIMVNQMRIVFGADRFDHALAQKRVNLEANGMAAENATAITDLPKGLCTFNVR